MARLIAHALLLLSLSSVALPLLAQTEPKPAAASPELRAYQVKVRDRVLEYWQPPDIDSDLTVLVNVRVDRDGRVSKKPEVTLVGEGKATAAEEAIVDAVQRAVPFAEVPANVAPYYVDVRFRLKIAAKTPATPKCYPVATFIDLPAEKQVPVKAGITNLTGLLRDSTGANELFTLVDSRDKADLVIESSSDSKLPRIAKTNFAGSYTVNDSLSTGLIRLGLKTGNDSDLTNDQLTLNTMQLLGRTFGLPGLNEADTVMSSSRIAPRLSSEQTRIVTDTVKAASCTPATAQRGFQIKSADASK